VKRYASLRYARLYDRLRAYDGGTQTALEILDGLRSLKGADIVELGAGTGTLTLRLAKYAGKVYAFDKSKFMIAVAYEKMKSAALSNCCLELADHRCIPLPNASADVVVAAWTLASLVYESSEEAWTEELDKRGPGDGTACPSGRCRSGALSRGPWTQGLSVSAGNYTRILSHGFRILLAFSNARRGEKRDTILLW